MQINLSKELGAILDDAIALSERQGKYFVGVEHLFEAAIQLAVQFPDSYPAEHDALLKKIVTVSSANVWQGVSPSVSGEVFYTPRCAAILTEAGRLAQREGVAAQLGHMLLAILSDHQTLPARVLDGMNVARKQILNDLGSQLRKPATVPKTVTPSASENSTKETQGHEPAETPVGPDTSAFTRDLTAEAKQGRIEGVIGRSQEIMSVLEILARKGKSNVILVGEPGVGKTKIAEGLAACSAQGSFNDVLGNQRILELNLGALMSGTQLRGSFEDKIHALISELETRNDTILFIDEIHLMMGAGATDGDGMDLANLLKPVLSRGGIRVIGATTLQEYRKFIRRDAAIERRFQMVRVEPLSVQATEDVLRALKEPFESHHHVRIGASALRSAIELTERYVPNRHLPDKAIDALDQACARTRIKRAMAGQTGISSERIKITPHHVRKVVSQMAGIPLEEITADERARLTDLDKRLASRVIGQDEAVEKVAAAVRKSRAGLADPDRPDAVMLFLGPTGVGKTQLAKELAKAVFGSKQHLVTFDMSEYVEAQSVSRLIGAPPGYAGCDEDGLLAAAVLDTPYCVLLFDEIEKAHPKVFDILLPLLEEGRLKDAQGREVSFRNTTIIFTSNVGAENLSQESRHSDDSILGDLREHFRPEFINRIDEIVPFYPLLFEDVRAILKQQIDGIRRRLINRRIGIRMFQGAYEHLAEEGYNAEFGARELRRVVERLIAGPLSDRLLTGDFEDGDMIEILMVDGALTYRKGAPRGASKVHAA